ncbi:MAG: hypothetical protein Q8R37_02325 [Nanoarchaeota archaeon]|nr:hypothetical protein [Nanoarchaeota archaeon]
MKENIFETNRGIYQVDPETGLFTVNRCTTLQRYLGSIDPNSLFDTMHGDKQTINQIRPDLRIDTVIFNFLQGYTSCFTPEFKESYKPFGITCHKTDIMFVGEHDLAFSHEFKKRLQKREDGTIQITLGAGQVITHVYRQLTEAERGYKVLP